MPLKLFFSTFLFSIKGNTVILSSKLDSIFIPVVAYYLVGNETFLHVDTENFSTGTEPREKQ